MTTRETPAPLPLRAWHALRERGLQYAWHKTLRRALGRWPTLKRWMVYHDPRTYWTLRGGFDYLREQEGQSARTERSRWMAERIAAYRPQSILEVGCGYGKQLVALRSRVSCPIVGVDFSPSQLAMFRSYAGASTDIQVGLASGARLPFADRSFDLVLTSAVILHNPPEIAERIRNEVVRVARRWTAHNEDLDTSYNRFGYDTAAWYRARGYALAECGAIPVDPSGPSSQFCVALMPGQ